MAAKRFSAARSGLVTDSKTLVTASWGTFFYDKFRLGLARDIPAFGGANLSGIKQFPTHVSSTVIRPRPATFGLCPFDKLN